MLNLNFQNGQAPALNARNMNAIVESINETGTQLNTVKTQLTSPFNFKGAVADYAALEAIQNPEQNDTYYVVDLMCRYTWTGSGWEQSSLNESEYEDELSELRYSLQIRVDSLGNVFSTPKKMDEWIEEYKDCPSCKMSLGDYDSLVYKSNLTTVTGLSTINHPIKFDKSLYLKINIASSAYASYVYFGHIIDGEFVVEHVQWWASPHKANLAHTASYFYEDGYGDDLYIALAHSGTTDTDDLNDVFELYRRNPYCSLTFRPSLFIINSESVVNTFVHGDSNHKISYYSNVDGSSKNIRPGSKWLYAGGFCLDAEFYDEAGNVILCEYPIGDLGEPDNVDYSVCIPIPENAWTYKMAVYGYREGNAVFRSLGVFFFDFLQNTGVYGSWLPVLPGSRDAGQAVKNANEICQMKYNAPRVFTRLYSLNYPNGYSLTHYANSKYINLGAVGSPYSQANTAGSDSSWYTLLSALNNGNGMSTKRWAHANFGMGVSCASFISEVLGLNHKQGVEWFLQKFHDKLEVFTKATVLEPGDLMIKTAYRFCEVAAVDTSQAEKLIYYRVGTGPYGNYTPNSAKSSNLNKEWYGVINSSSTADNVLYEFNGVPNPDYESDPSQPPLIADPDAPLPFYQTSDEEIENGKQYYVVVAPSARYLLTHIKIVSNKVADAESGGFGGYEFLESTNTWTRRNILSIPFEPWYWKLPGGALGEIGVNTLRQAYAFNIDKNLDTIRNSDSISFPPLSHWTGDHCIIGTVPDTPSTEVPGGGYGNWLNFMPNTGKLNFIIHNGYDKITIKKDGAVIVSDLDFTQLDSYVAGANPGVPAKFSLEDYIQSPGTYQIFSGTPDQTAPDYTDATANAGVMSTFFWPVYPDVKWTNNYKTVEFKGNLSDWDEVWFRVRPHPVVIDGYPKGTPWTNYMYVNGADYYDEQTGKYDVSEDFILISQVELRNTEFGARKCVLCGDYTADYTMDGDDEQIPIDPDI